MSIIHLRWVVKINSPQVPKIYKLAKTEAKVHVAPRKGASYSHLSPQPKFSRRTKLVFVTMSSLFSTIFDLAHPLKLDYGASET